MESFTYDSVYGHAEDCKLMLDHKPQAMFKAYYMIPFYERAKMIQAVITSVVDDDTYMPYNYHFALAYQLIRFYSDIEFPEVQIEQEDGESDEAYRARKQNATMSSVFEFIKRSNVMEQLRNVIIDYDDIVAEVDEGIAFAKQRLLTNTPVNKIGDMALKFVGAFADEISTPENIAALREMTSKLASLSDLAAELNENAEE